MAAQVFYESNKTWTAVPMALKLAAGIWALMYFVVLVTSHPSCSPIYGHPDASDCRWILRQMTGSRPERGAFHCFTPANIAQPDDVSNPQWLHKVEIPKFWSQGNCRIALWPVLNSSDGSLSYDISRWLGIQTVGLGITHYCVEALGMPGLEDERKGGVDSAGDNNRLRLILYAPKSTFENDTIANFKANKPIAIEEETDDEYEPGPSSPAPSAKRRRTGGMGLMSSKALQTRVRNLGGGCILSFDSTTSIMPTQIGAARLEESYTKVVYSAADQISAVVNATEDLTFAFNGLKLRLSSSAPITWTWILNFAADMLDNVSNEFAWLFTGEAYSAYWEIPAVTALLSLA